MRSGVGIQLGLAALLVLASTMTTSCASADPGPSQELHAVDPASTEGKAMIDTATADAAKQLGKPVKIAVKKFNSAQGWAYLYGTIQEPDGSAIDLSDTPLAEAAANGGASNRFDGLFQASGSNWKLIDGGVGATSPMWEDWHKTYPSTPVEMFR